MPEKSITAPDKVGGEKSVTGLHQPTNTHYARTNTTKEIIDQRPTGLGARVKEYW
jgi:hypothetical protein